MNHEAILISMIVSDDKLWYLAGMKHEFFLGPKERQTFRAMESAMHESGYLSKEAVAKHYSGATAVIKDGADQIIGRPNWELHRREIIKAWKSKALVDAHLEAKVEAEEGGDPDVLIDQLISDLQSIRTENIVDSSESYKDRVQSVLKALEERYKLGGLPGLETSISPLDAATGGLQRRRLYYVGARPSQGKSALIGQMAGHLVRQGVSVGFISLESAAEELITRDWSRSQGIKMRSLSSGMLKQSDFAAIDREISQAGDRGYWIDDTPNSDIRHVQRQAQVWKARHDIKVLFVDYAQLIRVSSARDRREQVEEASRALKDLSRHLDIPVVAAAQLRRDADDRVPNLGDFQHSSALEQDADACLLLHWKDFAGETVAVDGLLSKNRDGEKLMIPLAFKGDYTSFHERTMEDVDE